MKLENNWRDKSIEKLEKRSYSDPANASTLLVKKCLECVKLPVGNLSVEQLRLLIGQEIGLSYLIPLALDILDNDILAEGDFYPGDLLKSVTMVDVTFWKANPDCYMKLRKVIKNAQQRIEQEELAITIPEI